MSVRVLIADDQQLIRDGFRMILATDPDIEIVGEASNGAQAVALTRELRPDVVLMDIRMPELDGIEATRRILAHNHDPKTNVLILTTFDLDEYVYDACVPARAGSSSRTCPRASSSPRSAPSGRATPSSPPASHAG